MTPGFRPIDSPRRGRTARAHLRAGRGVRHGAGRLRRRRRPDGSRRRAGVGFTADYRHEIVEADVRHPGTWQRVQELIGEARTQPVFVLGCGFDGVNIRTALWLSGRFGEARIVARCFDRSSFTEQISKECGFEIVSTADLLLESMRPEALA